jgi:ankyrin repeat protein
MTTSLEALLEAIKRKDAAAVTHALDAAPALATARSASGQTPAIVAIYWRAPEMLALLRARGAELDVFEAAAAGDAERVRAVLAADPSLRDAPAPDGWTPLHLASHFRQTGVIELLLAQGADVNAVSRNADANAPLHAAAAGGADAAVMGRLLRAGARVNHRQSGGFTALHEVAAIGNAEVARLLLDAGAEPDARNTEGQTPAELARAAGHAAVAEMLDAAARRRAS